MFVGSGPPFGIKPTARDKCPGGACTPAHYCATQPGANDKAVGGVTKGELCTNASAFLGFDEPPPNSPFAALKNK